MKTYHSTQSIAADLSDEVLTPHAGHLLLARVAEERGVVEALRRHVRCKKRRRGYDEVHHVLALLHTMAAGGGALAHVSKLREDRGWQCVIGLEGAPEETSLLDFLRRVPLDGLTQVNADLVRREIESWPVNERVQLFLDRYEIEIEGQYFEGATKGYDGHIGFGLHVLYVGQYVAGLWLMPANESPKSYWRQLLEPWVPVLAGRAVHLFLDSAYYCKEVAETLDAWGWGYTMSVNNQVSRLEEEARWFMPTDWQLVDVPILGETRWVAEQEYQPDGWDKPHRFVVIRRKRDGELFEFFSFILVGNRGDLEPKQVELLARRKGDKERMHDEFIRDLNLHPPSSSLAVNRAYFAIGALAHNLIRALVAAALPEDSFRKRRPSTLRYLVLTWAARITRHARRCVVRFSKAMAELPSLLSALHLLNVSAA